MLGSIIGAGIGAAGSLFGAWQASKAMKAVKGNIEKQRADNEAWYNRRMNEDGTQRADAVRVLARTEEAIKARNKQAAAAAAVTGGTEESVAATRAANAAATAEAAGQIAAGADARKDQVEATYQQRNAGFDEQLNQLEQQKAASTAQAAQGLASVGSQIAGMF